MESFCSVHCYDFIVFLLQTCFEQIKNIFKKRDIIKDLQGRLAQINKTCMNNKSVNIKYDNCPVKW